jgi:hypothetical protein
MTQGSIAEGLNDEKTKLLDATIAGAVAQSPPCASPGALSFNAV